MLESARLLRAHPQLRNTPIIVFATLLNAEHIESAAQSGLLWLQITPVEKLVAAVRGLLSATVSSPHAEPRIGGCETFRGSAQSSAGW